MQDQCKFKIIKIILRLLITSILPWVSLCLYNMPLKMLLFPLY